MQFIAYQRNCYIFLKILFLYFHGNWLTGSDSNDNNTMNYDSEEEEAKTVNQFFLSFILAQL